MGPVLYQGKNLGDPAILRLRDYTSEQGCLIGCWRVMAQFGCCAKLKLEATVKQVGNKRTYSLLPRNVECIGHGSPLLCRSTRNGRSCELRNSFCNCAALITNACSYDAASVWRTNPRQAARQGTNEPSVCTLLQAW